MDRNPPELHEAPAEGARDRLIEILKRVDDGVYASLNDQADAILAALFPVVPAREMVALDKRIADAAERDRRERDKAFRGESYEPLTPRHEAPAEGAGEDFYAVGEFVGRQPVLCVHGSTDLNNLCPYCEGEKIWGGRNYRARSSAPEAREGGAVERIADGLAHLVAAISLLNRAEEIGKKPSMATGSKKMFDQMLRDYEGAANRMRKAIYTRPAAPSADKLRIAVEKVRDQYKDQMRFCDIEPLPYFREFVRRIDAALQGHS